MMTGKLVQLRPKIAEDVELDYAWQTDAELARLDACPKLPMSFPEYAREYTLALSRGAVRRQMYAVETTSGKHIGNCVYHENATGGDITEIGIMIGDRDYWNRGYGMDAVRTLVDHIFTTTGYQRIVLKTLTWNERAQKCFAHCGFTEYARDVLEGYDFVFMELARRVWQADTPNAG
jgi:RimJ/RimL family protein N-acetyltransferase